MINYEKLMQTIYGSAEGKKHLPVRMLCLDPGATTGWSLFIYGQLSSYGQIETIKNHDTNPEIDWFSIQELFINIEPTLVICEDYRVYSHKLDRHAFSKVPTLRLIGGIELISFIDRIPVHYQMATQAKGFATDDKLKAWGFWKEGMRHSRDSIRHGLYYLIVRNKTQGGK